MNTDHRYFIDDVAVIYTIFPNGTTNAPYDIEIPNADTVFSKTADGIVNGEYTLHPNLTALAKILEP